VQRAYEEIPPRGAPSLPIVEAAKAEEEEMRKNQIASGWWGFVLRSAMGVSCSRISSAERDAITKISKHK